MIQLWRVLGGVGWVGRWVTYQLPISSSLGLDQLSTSLSLSVNNEHGVSFNNSAKIKATNFQKSTQSEEEINVDDHVVESGWTEELK